MIRSSPPSCAIELASAARRPGRAGAASAGRATRPRGLRAAPASAEPAGGRPASRPPPAPRARSRTLSSGRAPRRRMKPTSSRPSSSWRSCSVVPSSCRRSAMSGACSRNARSSSGTKLVHRPADEPDRQPADLAALHAPGLAAPRPRRRRGSRAPARGTPRPPRSARPCAGCAAAAVAPTSCSSCADLLAERRLGHVQALRRAAEVQFLGDGDEVAKVSELHVLSPP